MVEAVVEQLELYGMMDNTYIVYTCDNGFHIGQHRLPPGKTCAFEEEINVSFLIRGPGVPKGKVTDVVTSHTDIAPTLFQLAGIQLREEFDGSPIPLPDLALEKSRASHSQEHVAVEFWGVSISEGVYARTSPQGCN